MKNDDKTKPTVIGTGPVGGRTTSHSPKETGQAGKTVHLAQVKPAVPACSCNIRDGSKVRRSLLQSDSSNEVWRDTPSGEPDETCVTRTVGCTMALTKAAKRKEAASAQALNRGYLVTMVEVPDEDNDISFQRWLASGSPMIFLKQRISVLPTPPESPKTPTRPLPNEGVAPTCIRTNEVTSPTVAMPPVASAKVQEAPHQWMRPFKVNWMLRAICEA